ncbi:MAG: DMT family transporter [Sulfuriflexus sp.]|nr:DMT family transporter [Sulfuriflexus sp.]
MASNSQYNLLPVGALLLSATMWGVLWYPLRLLESQGLAGLWTSLIMYSAAGLVAVPWMRKGLSQLSGQWSLIIGLMLVSGWANIAFILAVIDGNVLRVLLLFFLSPLWAVILGRLFLNERLGISGAITLFVAMFGAVLMLWRADAGLPMITSTSDFYALTAGMAFAVGNVLVRKMQDVPAMAKAASVWWGVAMMAAVWIAVVDIAIPTVGSSWVYGQAILLGFAGMVVMTMAVQYGVTRMPVQRSAVILLFELVAGAVSAQLLTNEIVLPQEWWGGGLILIAGYLAARREEAPVDV